MTRDRQHDREMDALLRSALRRSPGARDDCPAAGDLAAFVEGRLDHSERHRLESHLSACDSCQAALAAIARMPAPEAGEVRPGAPIWHVPLRFRWAIPAAAAVAGFVVYLSVRPALPPASFERQARSTSSTGVKQQADIALPPPDAAAARADAAQPRPERARRPAVAPPSQRAAIVARSEQPARPAAPPPAPAPPSAVAAPSARVAESVVVSGKAQILDNATRSISGTTQLVMGSPVVAVAPDGRTRWRFDKGVAVFRSSDSGLSWQRQFSAESGDVLAASAPDTATCWAVGRNGLVLATTDGSRWETRPFPEKVDLTAVNAADATRATVTARDGRRFTTADGGATWAPAR